MPGSISRITHLGWAECAIFSLQRLMPAANVLTGEALTNCYNGQMIGFGGVRSSARWLLSQRYAWLFKGSQRPVLPARKPTAPSLQNRDWRKNHSTEKWCSNKRSPSELADQLARHLELSAMREQGGREIIGWLFINELWPHRKICTVRSEDESAEVPDRVSNLLEMRPAAGKIRSRQDTRRESKQQGDLYECSVPVCMFH